MLHCIIKAPNCTEWSILMAFRGNRDPYMLCNHNLYIETIISPETDSTQSKEYKEPPWHKKWLTRDKMKWVIKI